MKKLLLLLLIILRLMAHDACAQVSKADSHFIDKYRDRLNRELFVDLYKDEYKPRKKYGREFIDSVLHEYKTGYGDGHVSYAPDGKFKIFVFEGESCGGNCSIFYGAFIQLTGKKAIAKAMFFLPVTRIYKLKDNKYLVLQKGAIGGGNLMDACAQATLIGIKANKIIQYPIRYSNAQEKSASTLYIQQSDNLAGHGSDGPELAFDPEPKRISYKYISKQNYTTAPDSEKAYTYAGYFQYENGMFIFKKETRTVFEP